MANLFNRFIEVKVDNIILASELRYKFDIKRSLLPDPNTCDIEIYGLSENTRGRIKSASKIEQNKIGSKLYLKAGYKELYEQIFSGELIVISHEKNDADWVSKLKCADGFTAYNASEVETSFKKGVSFSSAIDAIYGTMGLSGKNTKTITDDLSKKFDASYVISGKAKRYLDDLSKSVTSSWSIQDFKLLILKDGKAINETSAIRISNETGLVGSPKRTEKGINFTSLLNPKLKPGYLVQLESNDFNKIKVVIQSVNYVGDTHTNDWYAKCEGLQI